ncbi:DUF551 domain-containing protein [Chitinimonas viridis]|uniref:DUF551 domain-containing protein n=1 Tax=Chitinimonas viridis TaxID=664880 RepID=A0ABT8BAR2_9NEIS|nr:DUF551 domain-containing protein [Chitinimonas viridis]MDN3578686.1 DUF551 domain-containing protein [Chitinimonas viridis]
MLPWNNTQRSMPDAGISVLVFSPLAPEPVWMGYHDGADWMYVDGVPATGVTHWSPVPPGPEQ